MADPLNPYSGPYQGYLGYGDPGSFAGSEGRRRIIAALLAKQRAFPKNIGEGIASVGESIGNVLYLNSLAAEDKARGVYEATKFGGLPTESHIPSSTPATGTVSAPAQQSNLSPVASTAAATGYAPPAVTNEAPYIARGAAPGNVPVPPPRPQLARPAFNAAIEANPALIPQMAAMVNSENPAQAITQLETLANRQEARGTSLDREIATRAQNPNAYYPAFAHGPGDIEAFKRNVLTPVMRGSDVGGQQLGFSPTGNASGQFAEDRLNKGIYNIAGHIPGNTEMYVQQENPAQLSRLEASRVPGRDAITQAIVGPPPVQTAALTTPGRMATDAGPEQPVTPPVSSTATAQAPAGNPPITVPIARAPASIPSLEDIPPASDKEIPVLDPEPKQPGPVPMSPRQQALSNIIDDPRISTEQKQRAERAFNIEEKFRADREKMAQDVFHNQRAQYDQNKREREKIIRDMPDHRIDQHIKRLQIEAEQAKAVNRPAEAAKLEAEVANLQADLNKKLYEQTQRPMGERKTLAETQEAERKANAPDTFMSGNAQFRVPYTPGAGYGPAVLTPGSPPPAKTETQAKADVFVKRVTPDLLAIEANPGYANELATSPLSSLGSSVGGFFGLGNVPVSAAYREAVNRFGNWGAGFLTHVSGVAVTPSEAATHLPAFIPRYRDDPAEQARKVARIREYTDAVASISGDQGHEAAMQKGREMVMRANGELPVVTVKSMAELKKLGAGQHVILPDGSPGRVPWPKDLIPK